MTRSTDSKSSIFRAALDALSWRNIDTYPFLTVDGVTKSWETAAVMEEFGAATADWISLPADKLDKALEFARQSLNEVKSQTEYQDQKATRLLTVTTFLTAFSGVLFTRFQDNYPLTSLSLHTTSAKSIIIACYVLFTLFILTALFGALVTFHATRTRFKYVTPSDPESSERDPRSLLFFESLIRVRPRAWANAWVSPDPTTSALALRGDLKQRYLANLVGETYLVAAKTADKLRQLAPAQSLLATSLRFLFLWLAVLGGITIGIPAVKPPAPDSAATALATPPVPSAAPTPAATTAPTAASPPPAGPTPGAGAPNPILSPTPAPASPPPKPTQ